MTAVVGDHPFSLAPSPVSVLQVTPRFPPFAGGIETHVYETTRRMASRGVSCEVLTTDPTGKLPRTEIVNGVHVTRVPAWPRARDWYVAPELGRFIASGTWDVVHIQGYHTLLGPTAMTVSAFTKRPYIVSFHSGGHSSRLRTLVRRPQRLALRPLLRHAARLVAVSSFEAALFRTELRLAKRRFVVIPNGGDAGQAPDAESVGSLPRRPYVVSIGRLERYKGHEHVIRAFARLLLEEPHMRLLILGAGPDEQRLNRIARSLYVHDRVEVLFVPAQDRARLAALLSQASLVTLLSDYEAHPVAAMEAASLGRPLLVKNSTGLSELVELGVATGLPEGADSEDIASAMLDAIRSDVRPAGPRLQTWDDTADQLASLYREIAAR